MKQKKYRTSAGRVILAQHLTYVVKPSECPPNQTITLHYINRKKRPQHTGCPGDSITLITLVITGPLVFELLPVGLYN